MAIPLIYSPPPQECPVVKTVRETLDTCDEQGITEARERLLTVYLALYVKGPTSPDHRRAARQARRILGLRSPDKEQE